MKKLNVLILSLKITVLAVAVVFIYSCEKVIEIDIKDAEIQTVVEAYVNSTQGDNLVILSKSANFYEANQFPMIKGASVIISTTEGNFKLNEIEDGIYQHSELGELSNSNYTLTINIDGQVISSESKMPDLVPIDSISYVKNTDDSMGGGPNDEGEEEYYKLYVHFHDPANILNYYKIRVNSLYYQYTETFIVNDALFDGRDAKLLLQTAYAGDTVVVDLISIDKQNYEYFRLIEANDMGAFTTSIGNPVSNVLGENVIGVFGANAISTGAVIIPGNIPMY